MFKSIKLLYESGKDYPKNLGKLWTKDEENLFNFDIVKIAIKHERTIGGIIAKINDIVYKMYIDNISMDEIIEKTKLDEKTIEEVIEKKKAKIKDGKNIKIDDNSDIIEIKNDIKELKK
jgi:hypothetical protein